MSFNLKSTRASRQRRINNITRIGKKRIKKLENIEKRQRKTANRIISCPSCGRKFGDNPMCAACALKELRR